MTIGVFCSLAFLAISLAVIAASGLIVTWYLLPPFRTLSNFGSLNHVITDGVASSIFWIHYIRIPPEIVTDCLFLLELIKYTWTLVICSLTYLTHVRQVDLTCKKGKLRIAIMVSLFVATNIVIRTLLKRGEIIFVENEFFYVFGVQLCVFAINCLLILRIALHLMKVPFSDKAWPAWITAFSTVFSDSVMLFLYLERPLLGMFVCAVHQVPEVAYLMLKEETLNAWKSYRRGSLVLSDNSLGATEMARLDQPN